MGLWAHREGLKSPLPPVGSPPGGLFSLEIQSGPKFDSCDDVQVAIEPFFGFAISFAFESVSALREMRRVECVVTCTTVD